LGENDLGECGFVVERAGTDDTMDIACRRHVRETGHAVVMSASVDYAFEPVAPRGARRS
jgi:hypothetical protein